VLPFPVWTKGPDLPLEEPSSSFPLSPILLICTGCLALPVGFPPISLVLGDSPRDPSFNCFWGTAGLPFCFFRSDYSISLRPPPPLLHLVASLLTLLFSSCDSFFYLPVFHRLHRDVAQSPSYALGQNPPAFSPAPPPVCSPPLLAPLAVPPSPSGQSPFLYCFVCFLVEKSALPALFSGWGATLEPPLRFRLSRGASSIKPRSYVVSILTADVFGVSGVLPAVFFPLRVR